jgi:hypothetical protein
VELLLVIFQPSLALIPLLYLNQFVKDKHLHQRYHQLI